MQKRTALYAASALALSAAAALAFSGQVTGYYVSLGAGGNFLQDQRIKSQGFPDFNRTTPVSGQLVKTDPGFIGLASAGYGFGNGLRIELEGNYRENKVTGEFRTAPGSGHETQYGGFVNALYDFDTGYPPMTPYVGIGAGYEFTKFNNVNSFGFAANGAPFYDHNNGGAGNFATQVILGLAFDLDFVPGLSLTTEYRFTAMPFAQSYHTQLFEPGIATRDTLKTNGNLNHAILVGLRYDFNRPDEGGPEAPTGPSPLPPVVPARSYLVFFDWDRADLTARARQIIAEAAQASARVQVTRIEVNGYTDLSGTARYNQGLSVRRARAVQGELVRDGVPPGAISIHGYGESNPLVPTAKGVREAQNRRVEIIFH